MKKAFKMPTALTIVMIFLIIVGIMTWFVPTSVVIENDAGEKEIVFNAAFDEDGNVIENAGTSPVGLWDLFTAPINGMTDACQSILGLKMLPFFLVFEEDCLCLVISLRVLQALGKIDDRFFDRVHIGTGVFHFRKFHYVLLLIPLALR